MEETSFAEEISREAYSFAYLDKLRRLIEKETDTPIAVLLDRFFTCPHLATGDSRQIAGALWQELDEIREPVALIGDWMEKQDEETLNKLIHPLSEAGLVDRPVSEEEALRELDALSLEEFLELL